MTQGTREESVHTGLVLKEFGCILLVRVQVEKIIREYKKYGNLSHFNFPHEQHNTTGR